MMQRTEGVLAVPDPDLETRRGEPGLQKNFFRSFGPQFGLKIRGAGPPGPLPWIHHCLVYAPAYFRGRHSYARV